MATKTKKRTKARAKASNGKTPTLRTINRRLERELEELRKENRQLKRSLGALLCKDEPRNMDLKPEDGVFEPPLAELIAEIERAG
jgi:ribosomal protein L34E